MASTTKVLSTIMKATNSNLVINVCLVGSFLALSLRSMKQQNHIESLEAEKESLIKSNKAIQNTMWNWKQQLFAEASSDSFLIPLATLKAIYGESPTPAPPSGLSAAGESNSGASKIVI